MFEEATFIPGWMDRPKFHKNLRGLDIWGKKIREDIKIRTKYILAHSIGCNFALLNWKHNQNCNLILINPTLGSGTFGDSSWKWLRYALTDGRKEVGTLERKFFCLLAPLSLLKVKKYVRKNVEELLKNIPKDKVIIISGEKDKYFCTKEDMSKLRERGFETLEIKGMKHNFGVKKPKGGMFEPLKSVLREVMK